MNVSIFDILQCLNGEEVKEYINSTQSSCLKSQLKGSSATLSNIG